MINAVKFAISVLALAAACLAQEGLTIDNKQGEGVYPRSGADLLLGVFRRPRRVRSPASDPSAGQTCSGRRQERGMD